MKLFELKIIKLLASKKELLLEIAGILIIIGLAIYTRFYNLGYSDYIGDEHKAFYQPEAQQTMYQFFMNQRKGPMQFLVSHLSYLFTGTFRNELAARIPFAVVSVAAVLIFYLFIKKITKSKTTAFLAAFLYTINGFIVGFGRIAQYQNLNLLFSLSALYFYADLFLLEESKKILKSSFLGTIFWSLSFLSHWDAIFITPVVIVFFAKYIFSDLYAKQDKFKIILLNFLLGSVLLLPYLIPYTSYQLNNEENKNYFARRVEVGHINFERYRLLIELYNPYLLFPVIFILGLAGIFLFKQTYVFSIWFIFTYLIFEIFVRKPGTHIYNFVVPLLVITAIAANFIKDNLNRWLKIIWCVLTALTLLFLAHQTHRIFVNYSPEYPWRSKPILDLTAIQDKYYDKFDIKDKKREYYILMTPEYSLDQKLPLFGFPHKRHWNEINNFVNEQNHENNEGCGYMTNEVKTISEWYMDAEYEADGDFYIVGIKWPLSFVEDYNYPQIGGKDVVHEIKNEAEETVVRIYRVDEK